jgi:hypothetical protein
LTAFQEAQIFADAQTLILAEYTFLSQELQFCDETEEGIDDLREKSIPPEDILPHH